MTPQTVLILVGPEYEDLEVWYPKYRLEAAGMAAPLAGMGDQNYRGKHGYPCTVDGSIADFDPASLSGVFIPGGWAPDKLRRDPGVLALVRAVNGQGGLVASICHGPWVLISAGVVAGRRCTGSTGIKDDLQNACAIWSDEPVVTDGNLVSGRVPKDLPAFGEAMVGWLADRKARQIAAQGR